MVFYLSLSVCVCARTYSTLLLRLGVMEEEKHTHTGKEEAQQSQVFPASYLSRMSWLDVAAAPSSPSAALPTAAAAPLPASMILTHCNEPPARGAERVGGRERGWEGGGVER